MKTLLLVLCIVLAALLVRCYHKYKIEKALAEEYLKMWSKYENYYWNVYKAWLCGLTEEQREIVSKHDKGKHKEPYELDQFNNLK